MTAAIPTFRQLAVARLTDEFGPPRVIAVGAGEPVYRWMMEPRDACSIYVTLNCSDHSCVAHIVVSDPANPNESVVSLTMCTAEEMDGVIGTLRQRWPMA
jgi:hypothetical protein